MKKVKLYIIDSSLLSLDDLSFIPLTAEERNIVEKAFTAEKKKERLLSKYLKDKYVGSYYLDGHKKPLSDDKCFNLSHSDEMIVLGLCDVDIGVDIEHVKDISPKMKRFIASDSEFEYMSDREAFFEIWTNKESLVKCKGTGIVSKPAKIPGLPINGLRIFDNEAYTSKTVKLGDYIISVSVKGDEPFEIEQINITKL